MLPIHTATDWFSFQKDPLTWAQKHPWFEKNWKDYSDHTFGHYLNLINTTTNPSYLKNKKNLNIFAFLNTLLRHSMDWTEIGYQGVHAGHFILTYGTNWVKQESLLDALAEKGVNFHTPDYRGIKPWMILLTEVRSLFKEANHPSHVEQVLEQNLSLWVNNFKVILKYLPKDELTYSLDGQKTLMHQWLDELNPLIDSKQLSFFSDIQNVIFQHTFNQSNDVTSTQKRRI